MYSVNNGRVRVDPTNSVYSNISTRGKRELSGGVLRAKSARAGARSRSVVARPVRAKSAPRKPERGKVVSLPYKMEIKEPHRNKVTKSRNPLTSVAADSMKEAARSVMGQFFPSVYRNTFAAGETMNAPATTTTVTDRIQTTTQTNGSVFSSTFAVSPYAKSHAYTSATWAAGAVATQSVWDSQAYASILPVGFKYRCSGMEVVVEPTVASQNIQGEWAAYCYPMTGNTIVGYLQTAMNAPQASRGFFTDANPSARYILFKLDEIDDDWVEMNTTGGGGETVIRFDVQTAAAALLTIYITTTWTIEPNPIGQLVIPGQPVLIDQAAYQRGIQSMGNIVNENVGIITNPRIANKAHPGILARVAQAVATTVEEAWQLRHALSGAAALGSAVIGTMSGIMGDMDLEAVATSISMVSPELVERLKQRDDQKLESVPPEVLAALKVLSRYRVLRSKRGQAQAFECVLTYDATSINTVVLPTKKLSLIHI